MGRLHIIGQDRNMLFFRRRPLSDDFIYFFNFYFPSTFPLFTYIISYLVQTSRWAGNGSDYALASCFFEHSENAPCPAADLSGLSVHIADRPGELAGFTIEKVVTVKSNSFIPLFQYGQSL